MNTVLLRGVLLDGGLKDVFIEGNKFSSITPAGERDYAADKVIEGSGFAIFPPFFNCHTHSAMTLLRGYADDMQLDEWLSEHIWPAENKLTEDDIARGTELAIREMIRSGTVFFSDMYFAIDRTIELVQKMGVRAAIGINVMNEHRLNMTPEQIDYYCSDWKDTTGRVQIVMAPHAIYTNTKENLIGAFQKARKNGMRITMHISETPQEIENSIKEHGMRPIEYLNSLGLLGPDLILAHAVHVNHEEINLLARNKVTVVHCPCSNMKLSSGIFPMGAMLKAGVNVVLGTDGASSNNCLDMGQEMKFASLLAKLGSGVECLPSAKALQIATLNGARTYGIASGLIAEGLLADCILVSLAEERMQPVHNLVSNWVYSGSSSCIDTVICDGKVLMQGREVLV